MGKKAPNVIIPTSAAAPLNERHLIGSQLKKTRNRERLSAQSQRLPDILDTKVDTNWIRSSTPEHATDILD
jgi:hypothetical protein